MDKKNNIIIIIIIIIKFNTFIEISFRFGAERWMYIFCNYVCFLFGCLNRLFKYLLNWIEN